MPITDFIIVHGGNYTFKKHPVCAFTKKGKKLSKSLDADFNLGAEAILRSRRKPVHPYVSLTKV